MLSTLTAVSLASAGKAKSIVFVSSTSAIDTEHYVHLSDLLAESQHTCQGVPENDDLEGAKEGLKTGYGQTKWVSEKLLLEAGRRGLRGHIVRPGYVVGHSRTAGMFFFFTMLSLIQIPVTNTDDFIWRLVKGCVQLGLVPDMNNTVNMVPVDQVALATTLAVISPLSNSAMSVLHITARPLPTFNLLFTSLRRYGFQTETCEYLVWRRKLEQHVMKSQDNALYPLLHFVLDDLPTSTKSPNLDDANTVALLKSEYNMSMGEETMGRYFAWLVRAGFLPSPKGERTEKTLPDLGLGDKIVKAAGRSGV